MYKSVKVRHYKTKAILTCLRQVWLDVGKEGSLLPESRVPFLYDIHRLTSNHLQCVQPSHQHLTPTKNMKMVERSTVSYEYGIIFSRQQEGVSHVRVSIPAVGGKVIIPREL